MKTHLKKLFGILYAGFVMSMLVPGADLNPLPAVSMEARANRKAQLYGQFDLDGNGKLDRAERNLLRAELKAKMDPVRKRVIAQTNAVPILGR